jgi:hypothetical protein
MFLFHKRVLQYLACYWGWSCQFVFVGSTVWLPSLLDLFLLILVHVNANYYYYHNYYNNMLLHGLEREAVLTSFRCGFFRTEE